MTDKPIEKPRITPQYLKQMREFGFIAYREADGRIAFVREDIYAEGIASGEFPYGSSIQ
jgi:hypothetical protein